MGTEPIIINNIVKETSALRLLIEQFVESPLSKTKKRQKMMYALGGLLRGNREAQLAFLEIKGQESLSRALEQEILNDIGSPLAKRILALIGDIVLENSILEQEAAHNDNEKIIDSIASPSTCQLILKSLGHSSRDLWETAIRTFQSLLPYCHDWDMELALSSVVSVKRKWQVEPDLDPEVRRDLLGIAVKTIEQIRSQNQK